MTASVPSQWQILLCLIVKKKAWPHVPEELTQVHSILMWGTMHEVSTKYWYCVQSPVTLDKDFCCHAMWTVKWHLYYCDPKIYYFQCFVYAPNDFVYLMLEVDVSHVLALEMFCLQSLCICQHCLYSLFALTVNTCIHRLNGTCLEQLV